MSEEIKIGKDEHSNERDELKRLSTYGDRMMSSRDPGPGIIQGINALVRAVANAALFIGDRLAVSNEPTDTIFEYNVEDDLDDTKYGIEGMRETIEIVVAEIPLGETILLTKLRNDLSKRAGEPCYFDTATLAASLSAWTDAEVQQDNRGRWTAKRTM